MTLRRLLLTLGLLCFVVAALSAFVTRWDATVSDVLGVIAAGLACWIAATLP